MEQYASNRRLSLKQQHSVNELLSLKPNNKQLKDHIHSKYKKLVTLKDIQNMKAKMKIAAKNGRRDEQILLDSLHLNKIYLLKVVLPLTRMTRYQLFTFNRV